VFCAAILSPDLGRIFYVAKGKPGLLADCSLSFFRENRLTSFKIEAVSFGQDMQLEIVDAHHAFRPSFGQARIRKPSPIHDVHRPFPQNPETLVPFHDDGGIFINTDSDVSGILSYSALDPA